MALARCGVLWNRARLLVWPNTGQRRIRAFTGCGKDDSELGFGNCVPSGAKAPPILHAFAYGLKPVPFNAAPFAVELKPVPFKTTSLMEFFCELFSPCALSQPMSARRAPSCAIPACNLCCCRNATIGTAPEPAQKPFRCEESLENAARPLHSPVFESTDAPWIAGIGKPIRRGSR